MVNNSVLKSSLDVLPPQDRASVVRSPHLSAGPGRLETRAQTHHHHGHHYGALRSARPAFKLRAGIFPPGPIGGHHERRYRDWGRLEPTVYHGNWVRQGKPAAVHVQILFPAHQSSLDELSLPGAHSDTFQRLCLDLVCSLADARVRSLRCSALVLVRPGHCRRLPPYRAEQAA